MDTPEPVIVEKSRWIGAPPDRVWAVLTQPRLIRRWMEVEPSLDDEAPLELGRRLAWCDASGTPYLVGTVIVCEARRRLVLELADASWARPAAPGEVTYGFTLSEQRHGVRVDFRLGDLAIDADALTWRDAYVASQELERIDRLARENA